MPADRARSLRDGGVLLAVVLVALAVRLVPFPAATRTGLRLLSPDCYGHLRRAASVARNFPRVPVRDPYLNHPDGGVWIWPPAFDLAVGGAARMLYGPGASLDDVAWVAAVVPPVLGALHTVPLFFLARRLLGRRRAFLGTLAYALLPSAAIWSGYGHADQHVAETLGFLLFLAAGARAVGLEGRPRGGAALLAGAALALLVLTWQGALLTAALGLLWAALFLGPASAVLALAAAFAVALGAAATFGRETVPFSYVSFGWFQPLFLAALALPLVLLAAVRTRGARRAAALVAALVLAAAVVPNAGRIAGATLRGGAYLAVRSATEAPAGADDFADGGYLSYAPDVIRMIAESHPLLDGPARPALARAAGELSAGLFLLPFALALWAAPLRRWKGRAARGRLAGRALLVLFGALFLALTLVQRRNVYYLAVFAALALGELVTRVAVRVSRRLRHSSGRLAARGGAALTTAVLILALEIVPGREAWIRFGTYANAPGPDLLDLLRRLRALDPPPDPAAVPPPAPGSVPGVMAPWAMGHFVTALAERPAAADPFLYGLRRQARLFTATEDAEAREILTGARCRYLVTTDLRPVLPTYAAASGRPPGDLGAMFAVRVHESADPKPVPFLTRVLDSRTAARMPDGRIVPRFRVFRVDGGP
jgi:asparagine N-glycosylation enzyme membrane subunit Stt3